MTLCGILWNDHVRSIKRTLSLCYIPITFLAAMGGGSIPLARQSSCRRAGTEMPELLLRPLLFPIVDHAAPVLETRRMRPPEGGIQCLLIEKFPDLRAIRDQNLNAT